MKNLKSSSFMILFSRLSSQFLAFDGLTIYAALMGLVDSDAVLRTGSNPSYYSLSGVDIII